MRFSKLWLFSVAAAGLSACAADVADIDRTQADKVEKAIFTGEWYFRPIITEVQYNHGMVFEGYEGDMERIVWEVQKDYLLAYRSHELLIGAEDLPGDGGFDPSTPVAKFPIVSHFDVIRQFNPATGEQSNVLVEDDSLRPWYERDYVRVNWAANMVGNPYRLEGDLGYIAPMSFWENNVEPDNVDRPEVGPNAINIVGKYMADPDFYTCAAVFYDVAFCGSSEVKVKLSFKKLTGHSYETLYYPDRLPIRYEDGSPVYSTCYNDGTCDKDTLEVFERFGLFRHERRAYDKEFQWTRDGRIFLGHRWNIWAETRNESTGEVIPPENRLTREIVYYTNVDFPADQDAWDASEEIANEWDVAFRETVLELWKERDPQITLADVPRIFKLERNSCNIENVNAVASAKGLTDELADHGITHVARGNVERACAVLEWYTNGEFTWQKFGDLRYSFFNWVDTPQQAGPLGYGPSSADPITGEIVAANANMYGAAVDSYAAYAADVVALMNGQLQLEEIQQGTNIRDQVEESIARNSRALDQNNFRDQNQRMFEQRDEIFGGRVPEARSSFFDKRREVPGMGLAETDDERAMRLDAEMGDLDAVRGTDLERELLMSDEIKRALFGPEVYQPGLTIEEQEMYSPFDLLIGARADERRRALNRLGAHAIDMFEPEAWTDVGMVRLAKDLENSDWATVYAYMRKEIYRSVMTHEVGHTLGLRHNFSGSVDAINYNPSFWDSYNPTTGKVERVATAGNPNFAEGEQTTAEQYMYSSIMDYDARFYADSLHGIGSYDKAAIKFGYGGLVEVFRADRPAIYLGNFLELQDYHQMPKMFSGGLTCSSTANCDPRVIAGNDAYNTYANADAEALQAEADENWALWAQKRQEADAAYATFDSNLLGYLKDGLDNQTPNAAAINQRSYVRFEDLQRAWTRCYETNFQTCSLPDIVPYNFCPDERAGYYPECQPYDKGATFREMTEDRMQRYDAYYVFSNFKRDRWEFNDYDYLNSYIARLYDRYFRPMSDVFRYALYSQSGLGRDQAGNYLTLADFPLGQDWQAAGYDGLNFLAQAIAQPEPGTYCRQQEQSYRLLGAGETCGTTTREYCRDTVENVFNEVGLGTCAVPADTRLYCQDNNEVYRPLPSDATCASGDTLDVDVGLGKYYYTNWTDEYFYKATRIGTFWDKYAALFALSDNEGFFYRDFASYFDVGAFQLSYWSGGLKQEVLDVFSAAVSGQPGKYAMRYDASRTGGERFINAPVIDIYSGFEQSDYDLPRIESPTSWTLRYYGLLLPMARFNSTFDYSADYVNYTSVCLNGYLDCMDYTLPHEKYVDPLTGYEYVASWTDRPELALAANLLKESREFVETTYADARVAFEAAHDVDGLPLTTFTLTTEEQALLTAGEYSDGTPVTYASLANDRRLVLNRVESEVNDRSGFIEIVRWFAGQIRGVY